MFKQIANKYRLVEDIENRASTLNVDQKKVALVFGASGEQGRAVMDGLMFHSEIYGKIYGVTRNVTYAEDLLAQHKLKDHVKGRVFFLEADLAKKESIERVLEETRADSIFLVTTTDLPPHSQSCKSGELAEYQAIQNFFDALVATATKDKLPRHVVFSSADDVQSIMEQMSESNPSSKEIISPLGDGSIVANFTGKGRGADYGMNITKDIEQITVTLITLPFTYSNFIGAAIPIPNKAENEWAINACLGEGPIDMFAVSDLCYLVPALFENPFTYDGVNLRVASERLTISEVATYFTDIFGKDIIYNPLSIEEMANLPNVPAAGCMAQMAQYLANPRFAHNIAETEKVMFPRKPQVFKDWLLTHSDSEEFSKVGLNLDATPITSVCVFGSTGMEGRSVVEGLIKDKRKSYHVKAVVSDINCPTARELHNLDPSRVTLVQANLEDEQSLENALENVQGVFLITDYFDFYRVGNGGFDYQREMRGETESAEVEADLEEVHAKNVIDVCEKIKTVKHVVFCTMENINEMNEELKLGLSKGVSERFDAKARAAAYARKKNLSCTYLLLPIYNERFFGMLAPEKRVDESGKEKYELVVPMKDDEPLVCMSVEDIGKGTSDLLPLQMNEQNVLTFILLQLLPIFLIPIKPFPVMK